jgi:delta(3,5)-delta(2,4)-dienoyl-CoA isomerase
VVEDSASARRPDKVAGANCTRLSDYHLISHKCLALGMYNFTTLKVERVAKNVLHVILNRGPLNAMNAAFWAECRACFEEIDRDTECRAVVLSSGGRIFTAGLDLKDGGLGNIGGNQHADVARKAYHTRQHILEIQESFNAIERCGKPVIAAVHGLCVGGGVDMLSACDIRYCSKDAEFTIKEVDVGLAADVGTLQRFPKIVGNDSLVRELAYTARRFGAVEAKEIGFIGRIFADKEATVDAALTLAREIATKSPIAVTGTKQVLNYSRDHTVEEGLKMVALWNASMLQTHDIPVSVQAAQKKQIADYSKL